MKRGSIGIIFFILIFLLGCETIEKELTEEELNLISIELRNVSDEEIQAEIEAQESRAVTGQGIRQAKSKYTYAPKTLRKILEYRKSQRRPTYEITFNPEDWTITNIRWYYRDVNIEKNFKDYRQSSEQAKDSNSYQLVLNVKKKEYRKPFSIFQEYVVEDFSKKENRFVEFGKKLKKKIVVRVQAEQIISGTFTLTIINNNGNEESTKVYFVDKGKLVDEDGQTQKISSPKKKIKVKTCQDLVEIIPEHNQFEDNRINLVFMGHGYGEELAFVPFLEDFVDFAGGGTELPGRFTIIIDGEEVDNTEIFNGIFGEEPFKSNRDLFNLWYSTKHFPIYISTESEGERYCEEMVDLDKAFTDCQLPNTFMVHLVQGICRAHADFEGDSYTNFRPFVEEETGWSVRTVVHELGHSIGSLRDEYVETGMGDYPGWPNCASNVDEAIDFYFENEAYTGCSYTDENLRPTYNSIMRYQDPNTDFDYRNGFHLCSVFLELTGRIHPYCTEEVLVVLTDEPFNVYDGD